MSRCFSIIAGVMVITTVMACRVNEPPATMVEEDMEPDFPRVELSSLRVEPDDGEDFDPDACAQLLSRVAEAGVTHIDDLRNVTVSLEDFFSGNRTRHSIAANVEPPAPYDTAQGWFDLLKKVRSTEGVNDVRVSITMIEPYEDGRLGMWPYSDAVWINSSLDRQSVARLVAPLEPSEVVDASFSDSGRELPPPSAPPAGTRWYWIWWD